jgi:hypothetical protein
MSIEFKITGNQIVLIDEEDYDLVNGFNKWKLTKQGYPQSRKMINRKTTYTYMHRLIVNCPKNMQVDHINGNKLDNRKSNLRICFHADNCKNRKKPKTNTSGYKGVSFDKVKKRWIATIVSNKIRYHLGFFKNKQDAFFAYKDASVKLHQEFSNTE